MFASERANSIRDGFLDGEALTGAIIAAAIGVSLFLTGLTLLCVRSLLWWPLFMTGGLLLLASLNFTSGRESLLSQARSSKGKMLKVYAVYVLVGIVVEAVRIVPDLWEYAGAYNRPAGVVLLVLLGYPVLLALVFETYVLVNHVLGRGWLAIAATLAIVVAWNELPNTFVVEFWSINEPFTALVPALFVLGYLFEVLTPVAAQRYLK